MDLWVLATDLGLSVVETFDVPKSGYDPGERAIYLSPGMKGRVLRSVLAHEIGHHVLGHHPTHIELLRRRQETAANVWAARMLITPGAYADAEYQRDGHVPSMAVDLDVSDELVLVYQRQLLRTDLATYVAPRHGAGQYAHRLEVS